MMYVFAIIGTALPTRQPPPADDEDDEDDEDDTTTGRTITINPPSLSLTGRPGVVVPLGVLARTGTIDTPVTVTGNAAFISGGWHGHRYGCDSGRYTSEYGRDLQSNCECDWL